MHFEGLFEAHLTITKLSEEEQKQKFINLTKQLGIKPLLIHLYRGDAPIQPMTASTHEGTWTMVQKEINVLVQKIEQAGFIINRVKVEAHPDNKGVPKDENQAKRFPEGYFETHLKVLFGQKDEELLKNICQNHQAHLSYNAFKTHTATLLQEKFVTLRHYAIGKTEAFAEAQKLKNELLNAHFTITKTITEYCIFDNNTSLDNNWLTLTCQDCQDCPFTETPNHAQ